MLLSWSLFLSVPWIKCYSWNCSWVEITKVHLQYLVLQKQIPLIALWGILLTLVKTACKIDCRSCNREYSLLEEGGTVNCSFSVWKWAKNSGEDRLRVEWLSKNLSQYTSSSSMLLLLLHVICELLTDDSYVSCMNFWEGRRVSPF